MLIVHVFYVHRTLDTASNQNHGSETAMKTASDLFEFNQCWDWMSNSIVFFLRFRLERINDDYAFRMRFYVELINSIHILLAK